MTPQDTARKLHAIMGDSLLPYATTDMIIDEVKKGSPDVREKVMHMLVEYLTDAMNRKKDFDKVLQESKEKFRGSESDRA